MKQEKEVTMPLKLLVNTEGEKPKVLYAEADKDFVDFLFNIMSLPLGTILKLIHKNHMAGCLGDLYRSIESLDPDYLQDDVDRDAVLRPRPSVSVPLLSINNNDAPVIPEDVDNPSSPSAPPLSLNNDEGPVVIDDEKPSNKTGSVGYVKGGVLSYMVMDNLEVKPMSTNSVVSLMKKFNVKDASLLVERNVQVGFSQGVAILKASLETRAVLTNVFREIIDFYRRNYLSETSVPKRKFQWNCCR